MDACVILVVFSPLRAVNEFACFARRELSEKSRVENCLATSRETNEVQAGAMACVADYPCRARISVELLCLRAWLPGRKRQFRGVEISVEKIVWKARTLPLEYCIVGESNSPLQRTGRHTAHKTTKAKQSQLKLGKGDNSNEKDLSAKSSASRQATRISQEDVAQSGESHCSSSASQGKKATLSLRAVRRIGSLRLRSDFERLRRQGMTARSGNVQIRYAVPARSGTAGSSPGRVPAARVPAARREACARIAYAIGKKAGKAVQRNRLRRQLRAIFQETSDENPELLPHGDYLVRVAAFESSRRQLKEDVTNSLKQLKSAAKSH